MEKVWLVGTNWQQVQGQCEEAEEAGGQARVELGRGAPPAQQAALCRLPGCERVLRDHRLRHAQLGERGLGFGLG